MVRIPIRLRRQHGTKRVMAVIVTTTGLVVASGIALASIPDPAGVFHGCYKTSGTNKGELRVIDSPTQHCTAQETAIQWNRTGPKGAPGSAGPTGPNYIAGGSGAEVSGNSTVLTGFDSQSVSESAVWHIVPTNMTFGHLYCASAPPPDGHATDFTVRITTFSGGTTTTTSAPTTCSIAAGATSAVASGTISISAGQAIDVRVAVAAFGAVSWSLGP